MHKLRCHNELRFPCSRESAGRAAFSLAELVISIGILILMLALAGQVFTITVRSTGQATALTDTSQQLRMFEDTLREDLRSVQPGQSLILIQGNPVNAYWTQSGKDADDNPNPSDGYGHHSDPEREDADGNLISPRADILMIFTSRKGTSYVSPNVTGRLQQVVYGHAELGEYIPNANPGPTANPYEFQPDPLQSPPVQPAFPVNSTTNYPSTTMVSQVPAAQWHLARRSVLLIPTPSVDWTAPMPPVWADVFNEYTNNVAWEPLLSGEKDVIYGFAFEKWVLYPWGAGPWSLPRVFYDPADAFVAPNARSWLDLTPPPIYANRLGHYFLPNCASFKVEWSLDPKSPFVAGRLDGTSEAFWIDPGDMGDPSDPSGDDPLRSLATRVKELKKGGTQCSSGDFVCRSLDSLLVDRTAETMYPGGSMQKYSLSDRFRGPSWPGANADYTWPQLAPDGRPNLEVFTATRPSVTGSDAPDDVWPGALRITVDVFDRERRLDRPIRHVIIVPVGG